MTSIAARVATASSLLLLPAALTGCGSRAAALDRETAMQHAMDAVANEAATPGAELYDHRIELRGAVAYGKGGWLVRIADRTTGARICVTDLPAESALGVEENISVARCRGAVAVEPPPASDRA